jgi:hypothetical protein
VGWTVFTLLVASIGVVRATRLVDDVNAHRERRVVASPHVGNQYWPLLVAATSYARCKRCRAIISPELVKKHVDSLWIAPTAGGLWG